MNWRSVTIIAFALFIAACKPKSEVKAKSGGSMTAQNINVTIHQVFTQLGFKIIACPDGLRPMLNDPDHPTVQECFTSAQQPESLLADVTAQLDKIGTVDLDWRQDFGEWTVIYDLNDGKHSLVTVLKPPYTRSDEPEVAAYNGANTVGFYLLNVQDMKLQ